MPVGQSPAGIREAPRGSAAREVVCLSATCATGEGAGDGRDESRATLDGGVLRRAHLLPEGGWFGLEREREREAHGSSASERILTGPWETAQRGQ